jgi:4-aminobutyrate aminotransferase-like enzyme
MRTGTWWNVDQKDVVPDIMTFGKGIASGYPLAGVVSTSEIMNSIGPGYLGGTYGGNAIASAAASATIDILNEDELQQNVITMGKYIKDNLINTPIIKEIRQYGLMIGIEFNCPNYTKEMVRQLSDNGVLVLVAGSQNQYMRLLPPLNVSKNEVDFFLEQFSITCA